VNPTAWPYTLAYGDPRHGSRNGYVNLACRCRECTDAESAAHRPGRASRAARLAADSTLAPHGNACTYSNWRCRCAPCTAAWAAYLRERRRAAS